MLSLYLVGILATQKNSLVESDQLKVGSVIKLEEFAANVLSKDPLKYKSRSFYLYAYIIIFIFLN